MLEEDNKEVEEQEDNDYGEQDPDEDHKADETTLGYEMCGALKICFQ